MNIDNATSAHIMEALANLVVELHTTNKTGAAEKLQNIAECLAYYF